MVKTMSLKEFKCHICHSYFCKQFSLNRHMKLHSGELPYACGVCEKKFIQKSDCQRHVTIHSDEMNFICEFSGCGKMFRTKKNLRSHERVHSSISYVCDICGKSLRHKKTWNFHLISHYEEKPFRCQEPGCFKAFPSLPQIKSHMNCHLKSRDFACPMCISTYKRKSDLKKHVLLVHIH